ncbi:MAG: 50S ribosomal protein L25 [Thermoanaerobacteraceae bacterium]|nr:50S ribosomal protein L25 [Thermoanaerobacteraceae bacterium]
MAVDINAYTRKPGKNYNLNLRREGKIPAVLYGKNVSSTPICVSEKDATNILARHGGSSICNLIINGSTFSAIIKEIQRDPVSGEILHMDFQQVSFNEKIEKDVPIVVTGEGLVESKGGIIQHQLRELLLVGYPQNLPEEINVDVSNLKIGDTLFVRDIRLPEGIETKEDPDEVILSVIYTRASEVSEEEQNEA